MERIAPSISIEVPPQRGLCCGDLFPFCKLRNPGVYNVGGLEFQFCRCARRPYVIQPGKRVCGCLVPSHQGEIIKDLCLFVGEPPSYYGEMIKNIRQSVGRHPLHHGEMINDLRPFVGKHQPRHGEIIKDFRLSVGRSPPRRDD